MAYAQDEWRARENLTLNYGLRYDYYTVLRERDDHIVKFNIDTGVIDPPTTPEYTSHQNVQPRLSATYSAPSHTVLRGGFGIFVGTGPDRGPDPAGRVGCDPHDAVQRARSPWT